MSLYKRPLPSTSKTPVGVTEFEILKSSHKFLRDEDERPASWDDQLAAKYYASLYREFTLCDLKHYKSGNFALRWRTEDEVLSGVGETTCGNTRCEHHHPLSGTSRLDIDSASASKVPLTTLELPFTYIEQGESKNALVKVVLCGRCLKKLMWKKTKEKKESDLSALVGSIEDGDGEDRGDSARMQPRREGNEEKERERTEEGKIKQRKRSRDEQEDTRREKSRKQRRPRSRSPRARDHGSSKQGQVTKDSRDD